MQGTLRKEHRSTFGKAVAWTVLTKWAGFRLNTSRFMSPPGTWKQRGCCLSRHPGPARRHSDTRSKFSSSPDDLRQTEFVNRDRCDARVDPPLSFVRLVQERSSFVQEGSIRIRCVGMTSMSDLPRLRYVRGQPSFVGGTSVVPALLGRNPDELENSEDRGSAGGHGNQHVRLRGASIDASKRSARLRQQPVAAAGQAVRSPSCTTPRNLSTGLQQGADRAKGARN